MAGIICKWLNYEVKLSKFIEYGTVGCDFSSGFLFAQIFWRYGLIDNLDDFYDFDDVESTKRNFSLLEPLWEQLEIQTTRDVIADIQRGKTSTIIEQLYKMFVNIESQKCHIKQPPASAREMIIQEDRHAAMKEIEQSISDSVEACWRLQDMMSTREMQLNVKLLERQEKTKKLLEGRSERIAERLREFVTHEDASKGDQGAVKYVKVKDYIADKRLVKKLREIKATYADLDAFEEKTKLPSLYKKPIAEDVCLLLKPRLQKAQAMNPDHPSKCLDSEDANFKWNQDYVDRIRLQLQEEMKLRLTRKQRKHQAVEEQLQLFQGTEREQIEEIMVEILLRQSKFEKKLINELMLIRKEKAVILESRRLHEKQLAEMREKEFAEALDLEQRRKEVDRNYRDAQIASDWQFHKLLLTKHREQCQKKHYEICYDIFSQIVDLSVCVAHHINIVGHKIPPRLWREWKVLFIQGKPFFSHVANPSQLDEPWQLAVEDIQNEEERLNALDEAEFQDYKNSANDWEIPGTCDVEQIIMNRSVLGHIVYTVLNQVYVFPPPPRIPTFPYAPFKMCLLGKPFIGKSDLCEMIVNEMSPMPIKILNPQTALEEALQMYQEVKDILSLREFDMLSADATSDYFEPGITPSFTSPHSTKEHSTVTETTYKFDTSPSMSKLGSSYLTEEDMETEQSENFVREVSPLAILGFVAWNAMKNGEEVDDNVMVKILLENIRQLPEGMSWILDGFPLNLQEAKYFETGMSAYYTPEDLYILHCSREKEPNIYELRTSHLLINPDPPAAPPPPKCSFDLVVYLDVEDKLVLGKASDHIASTEIDWDSSQLTIHQRLKQFNEDWLEVFNWYESMNALQTIPLNLEQPEVAVATIVYTLNFILKEKSKPKDIKSVATSNHVETKGEDYFLTHGTNDKAVQFPTPTTSLLESRLAAGEEYGDTLMGPNFSDSDLSFASGNLTEVSGSNGQSTMASVISSLAVSLSDLRPAQPGDWNWEFVKEPIPLKIANTMARTWQNMEMGYIEILKKSFRKIRQYQDSIIQTFYNIQQDFKQFLQRPDNKQDYVSNWQEEYNALDDDMRSDEETKAELHLRVDDLRHVLWEICDQRLNESKVELSKIVSCGWLDDWLTLMCNRYICLLQAEVDRFYDSLQIITDYYDSLEGLPLKELPIEATLRLPLLDMNLDGRDSPEVVQSNVALQANPKGKAVEEEDLTDEPSDSLLYRTYTTALAGIEKRFSLLYRSAANGDEIKSKNRGKGFSAEILTCIPPEILNAGVKQVTEPKEKINLEYFAAIAEEECRVKTNLWMIQYVGMYKSGEFNQHSCRVYSNLENLLGLKYQRELDAIEELCRAMGYAIEQEKPIQEELVLNDDIFFINADIILFSTPTVEYKVSTEELGEEGFTVAQILELCKQFFDIAPTGFITTYQLENIFNDIIAKDNHLEIIPDEWLGLKPYQVHRLMDYISGSQQFVNWRSFLLYLTKPWAQPSETQLIETLDRFRSIDVDNRGTLNKLQYDKQAELWFKIDRSTVTFAASNSQFYSRLANIKNIFFEIFNLSNTNPSIDYFDMLNHFTANEDPVEGFTHALALACGYPILTDVKDYSNSKLNMHLFTCKTEKFQTLEHILQQRPNFADETGCGAMLSTGTLNVEDCPIPFSVVFHAFQYTQPIYRDSNRMDLSNAELLLEELETIFIELGSFDCEPVPYAKLMESFKLRKKIIETSFFRELDIYAFVRDLLQSSVEEISNISETDSIFA